MYPLMWESIFTSEIDKFVEGMLAAETEKISSLGEGLLVDGLEGRWLSYFIEIMKCKQELIHIFLAVAELTGA